MTILLVGGHKNAQEKDIQKARLLLIPLAIEQSAFGRVQSTDSSITSGI